MKKFLFLTAALTGFATTALACPNWQADPNFGTLHLEANFEPDPHVTDTIAGGDVDLSSCLEGAVGMVTAEPDFDLFWSGESVTGKLVISFAGDGDTVLLINTPSETWLYNDDADGLDPVVSISNPEEGLYSIWIGTVDSQVVQGRLEISEIE